jgi:DNA-binding response OmpR family regulator
VKFIGKILLLTFSDSEDQLINKIISAVSGSEIIRYTVGTNKPDLCFPDLEIRANEQTVYWQNELVPLGHYEFFVLYFLAEHPSWIFTREQIYEAVWHDSGEDGKTIVTNVISRIRHKLWPQNPMDGYIRTVQRSGYKFEA